MSLYLKGNPLPIKQITPELLAGFRDFLINRMGNSHNTVVENMKVISRLLAEAGFPDNPCKDLSLSRETPTRNYLLEPELERLMALRLRSGSLEEATRDIFFVECRTGLRISDLLLLRWESVDGDFLHVRMQKTGRWVVVPVSSGVRNILERYRDLFSGEETYVFPFMKRYSMRPGDFSQARRVIYATSRIDETLKHLARRAGIEKRVSSHTGRHTFATMLISKGATIYEVKELLGHSDVKVTQLYAHLMDSRKRELVAMLE